jgi:hypothetical protein
MASRPYFQVNPVMALLGAALCGAAYGFGSSLLPLIKLDAIILMGSVIVAVAIFNLLGSRVWLNLTMGLIGGAVAVDAMWGSWYLAEYGVAATQKFVLSGPLAMYDAAMNISQTLTYSIDSNGTSSSTDAAMIWRLWQAETALMAVGPLAGALFARRRAVREGVVV